MIPQCDILEEKDMHPDISQFIPFHAPSVKMRNGGWGYIILKVTQLVHYARGPVQLNSALEYEFFFSLLQALELSRQ